jgi:lipopolysaccharide transport system ATP-binding protein
MKPIIEFRNIGKKFRINRRQKPYVSLRENILEHLKNPGLFFEKKEEFWALKDITFDIMPGESIGIIGKNGAGKTTLLKILSRITPPTTGEIKVRGRVASLLEVGTGFHPELTGRENIFFNGAILGMRRREVKKKFDEIVEFAGVEKFIDTPLKHYSSGMQLRLAFAVAAFLEAEILVVDEVLAVGDAEFQKKCLGKMEDVTKNEGRTVLFVSHNMGVIRQLCNELVYLNEGTLKNKGSKDDVISQYTHDISSEMKIESYEVHENNYLKLKRVKLITDGKHHVYFPFDEPMKFELEFEVKESISNVSFGIGITAMDNVPLFTTRAETLNKIYKGQKLIFRVRVYHNLRAGIYNLTIGVSSGNLSYLYLPDVFRFEITSAGNRPYPFHNYGIINCDSNWEISECLTEKNT